MVLEKDKRFSTPLHCACQCNASVEVILKLIEVGGKQLAVEKDMFGKTSLDTLLWYIIEPRARCENELAKLDLLIEHGGTELLQQTNETNNQEMTSLESVVAKNVGWMMRSRAMKQRYCATCSLVTSPLINKGIDLQLGGEYNIGGLLRSSSSEEVKKMIYINWDSIVLPALEQVMAEPHSRHIPILQALIVHKAPTNTIKSTTDRFPHSINTLDSFGKYPIDLAIQQGIAWDGGMKDIADAFASSQQTTTLHVCAKYGVQWENGTREMLEGNDVDIVERVDASTGLYLFMIAALGDKKCKYDLDSVYHMIKSSLRLVHYVGNCGGEEQHLDLKKS